MTKVLIIEDDKHIQELLNIHLLDLNCTVVKEADGLLGYDLLLTQTWDLLILDLMLPSMNGLDICKKIRTLNKQLPILMLTAKSEEIDKLLGLEIGADDYLTKPFSIREFIARVKALLRRSEIQYDAINSQNILKFDDGNLQIDIEKHQVLCKGKKVDLTVKEFKLLALLVSKPGKSYTRENLLNLVWGYEFTGYEHTVNSHINRLRMKIEPNINNPTYIQTIWGVGYRFSDTN